MHLENVTPPHPVLVRLQLDRFFPGGVWELWTDARHEPVMVTIRGQIGGRWGITIKLMERKTPHPGMLGNPTRKCDIWWFSSTESPTSQAWRIDWLDEALFQSFLHESWTRAVRTMREDAIKVLESTVLVRPAPPEPTLSVDDAWAFLTTADDFVCPYPQRFGGISACEVWGWTPFHRARNYFTAHLDPSPGWSGCGHPLVAPGLLGAFEKLCTPWPIWYHSTVQPTGLPDCDLVMPPAVFRHDPIPSVPSPTNE